MSASEYAFFLIIYYQGITATWWISRFIFLPKEVGEMLLRLF
jgi:hypothetical protein